jgi:hypothetical protein
MGAFSSIRKLVLDANQFKLFGSDVVDWANVRRNHELEAYNLYMYSINIIWKTTQLFQYVKWEIGNSQILCLVLWLKVCKTPQNLSPKKLFSFLQRNLSIYLLLSHVLPC